MKTKTKNLILGILVSVVASLIPAIIFGKWLEATIFFLCHWFIREQFPFQYHHIIPAMCRTITASVMFFGISFMLPLSLSLLSAIPICYFISWIGFIKKTSDNYEIISNELNEELEKIKSKTIYDMTEDELRIYARSKHLPEIMIDTLVLKVIHNYKWCEIMQERNYSKTAIIYHKRKINKILSVDL